ncbi:cation:proton antiporter [Halopiger aswanensis]|uniref:Sodium/proton antiporter (CPA1 family) n=1 Tax=Halopiger aswanensis TaxID=148449 RepID=A0A3R7KNH9_9EURY|nr:cation:proton antiporter [Halopiger aswanensis]RKD97926.1 sodium/proton antiporter (CPA1 family) [Halopiger aswanensis]
MSLYEIALVIVGVAVLGTVALPRLLDNRPVSFPIVYVAFGILVFSLPLELPAPDPLAHGTIAEHLTEIGVIVALMGAGLKIDRPPGVKRWKTTWRLLGITMPLTIAAAAVLGWWAVGLSIPTAVLLGAVIAPTDPVLAADVQVDPPQKGESDEVRFALTSEAGLNDGLAFPFTYLAIAMATAGVGPDNWLLEWLAVDVGYKIVVGVAVGWVFGYALAKFVFQYPASTRLAKAMGGAEALAATLIAYGLTELAGGYGFIAVFVAAVAIRGFERDHEYHQELHDFAEVVERLVVAVLLVLFGGAIATGLFAPLTWQAALVGLALVLLVRPVAGLLGLVGYPPERNAIAFFGIRGIGSFYYLAYGVNNAEFDNSGIVWSIVGFAVLVSIVVHGVTAAPVMSDLGQEVPAPEATE